MLNQIIIFSLKNRLFVIATAALILVYGAWTIAHLPVDVLPDLNRPTVTILTEAEGLAPEEVETFVTRPIETVLNGAPGVERVRSTSGVGLSVVYVEFDWDSDIYIDRQLVAEKIQLVQPTLPAGVRPAMGPISSIMGEIMLIGLSSTDGQTSPMAIRTLADWTIRQSLLTIPGVSQVISIGGGVKQYQVLVSPQKLAAFGLTLEEVDEALTAANINTTGGFVDAFHQEYLVRNIARATNAEDLKKSVVAYRDGVSIILDQVATIVEGPQTKRGDGSVNGKPAVILSVQKQPGANTIELTKKVDAVLAELRKTLPQDVTITSLFRQANFIEAAIGNVEEALRDGTILVMIVLTLFLLNFRTTVITLTAIPLSFILSALVFKFFGLSVNTMTLGGLAVAIGELVDDAIVDVENVFRRLKENRHKPNPDPALKVIYHASSEVRNSIVFATIIVVLVFIPLFALSGIEGKLFAPLGIAYVVSIIASLFVSLTVTPALCSYLLPKAKFMEHEEEGFLVRFLKRQDLKVLNFALTHPKPVMAAALLLTVLAAATVPFMGKEFLPAFNEGTATINLIAVPGTSLEESNQIATLAEELLLSVPEVISTGRRTGRAEMDEHAEGVHYSEIDVDFRKSDRDRETILGDLRTKLSRIPGVVLNIGQPISHRLDHLLSGVRAQIAIKLFGGDLSVLRDKAEEIRQALAPIPGLVDLQVEKQVLIPQIQIRIDRDKVRKYGVRVGDLAEVLETGSNGKVTSQIVEGQATFDVFLRFDDSARENVEAYKNLLIDTPSGVKVPLAEVAEVFQDLGPNVINHENVQRRIVISANTQGRDLGSVIAEIRRTMTEKVKLPNGYFVEYGGQFESQQSAMRLIAILSFFSLTGMFLVLYAHFRSVRIVLQVLVNIPLAMIGSVIAVLLTDRTFSVATLVGFITLCGIASRNTIMMVSHYIHLVSEEGETFGKEMIIRGSLERLVPVLMTSLTAGIGLIPLVLSAGEPGKEILYPVAVVILGGLCSSTLLDMIVTPAIFYKFGQRALDKYLSTHRASGEDFADSTRERSGV